MISPTENPVYAHLMRGARPLPMRTTLVIGLASLAAGWVIAWLGVKGAMLFAELLVVPALLLAAGLALVNAPVTFVAGMAVASRFAGSADFQLVRLTHQTGRAVIDGCARSVLDRMRLIYAIGWGFPLGVALAEALGGKWPGVVSPALGVLMGATSLMLASLLAIPIGVGVGLRWAGSGTLLSAAAAAGLIGLVVVSFLAGSGSGFGVVGLGVMILLRGPVIRSAARAIDTGWEVLNEDVG